MKKITTTLILAAATIFTYGQTATNTESADTSNIYHQALRIYVNNMDAKRGEVATLLVEKNYLFTDALPKQIGKYKIDYLDGYEVNEKLRRESQITLIRIIPLRLDKGVFFINIIPFTVKKEKRNLRYLNSGGDGIIFEFDCNTKAFYFKEIMRGNI